MSGKALETIWWTTDMDTEPCIFHIDIDAFFASVETLRNPRLAERPVAVGAGVIASCSYDARRFGLHAGMPLREARKRCPGLVVLEGHYPIYRCYAEQVFGLCREYSPAIETHLDEAFCDLSGTERLYSCSAFPPRSPRGDGGDLLGSIGRTVLGEGGQASVFPPRSRAFPPRSPGTIAGTGPQGRPARVGDGAFPPRSPRGDGGEEMGAIDRAVRGEGDGGASDSPSPSSRKDEADALFRVAGELVERVRREVGLSVSLGMGRNRMLAKMASKSAKPAGLRRVRREEEEGFLRPLPVRLLPGVGPRTAGVLTKLNIETIEEMRALSRDSLKAMFGQNGELLHERCRGEDTRIVSTREIPRSISRETSFHEDTISPEEIDGMLHYLTERAANTLRKLGLKTRTIEVKLRYADFKDTAGGRTLRTPTQIDGEIFEMALALRRSLHTRRVGLRLIGVTLSKLVPDDGTRPLDLLEEGTETAWGGDLLEGVLRAAGRRKRSLGLCRSLDRIRERFGYSSVVSGKSLNLLGKLPQDAYGYILRTPSLTK